jgi:hypothetical protein
MTLDAGQRSVTQSAASPTSTALNRYDDPGAARMLVGDAYTAICLLKEALRRIAGIPTGASFLTTIFAIGVLANSLRRVAAPALRVLRPRHPSFAGSAIALAVLREAPGGIAGARARDTRLTGTIIAMSLLAPAFRRVAVPARRARAAFGRRYSGAR